MNGAPQENVEMVCGKAEEELRKVVIRCAKSVGETTRKNSQKKNLREKASACPSGQVDARPPVLCWAHSR